MTADRKRIAEREVLPGVGLSLGAGMGATVGVLVTGTAIGLALGGGIGAGIGLVAGAIAATSSRLGPAPLSDCRISGTFAPGAIQLEGQHLIGVNRPLGQLAWSSGSPP